MFNKDFLEVINNSSSKLVLVTKYFDELKTQKILSKISSYLIPAEAGIQSIKDSNKFILALGENRIDEIIKKKIPRDFCHFIGNIQSRIIPQISKNCSVIHSLCNLKHAEVFAKQNSSCDFFLQVNVSGELQKQGIKPENFVEFYSKVPKDLNIIGISGMGSIIFSEEEKVAEFKTLLDIKSKLNPKWLISAGTSTDYEIALKMGIDILRIGKSAFN